MEGAQPTGDDGCRSLQPATDFRWVLRPMSAWRDSLQALLHAQVLELLVGDRPDVGPVAYLVLAGEHELILADERQVGHLQNHVPHAIRSSVDRIERRLR